MLKVSAHIEGPNLLLDGEEDSESDNTLSSEVPRSFYPDSVQVTRITVLTMRGLEGLQ